MQIPVQISFRNTDPSPALEERVRDRAAKLERHFDRIMSCRVMVETRHRHHHKGHLYHIRIDVTVPGTELVVNRQPDQHHAHEDPYVALRDAFDAMERKLEEHAQRIRHRVKRHEPPAEGRIRDVVPDADYGVIETDDGRELRFTRNSVVDGGFDQLKAGVRVRYVEAEGAEEPAASTVHIVGTPHAG